MRLEVFSFWRRLWERPAESPPKAPAAIDVEPTAQDVERREALRHPCPREVWLHPVTLVQSAAWHAIVLDLSTQGVGLAIERPVVPGTFFAIEFPDPLQGKARTCRARVVYATPHNHQYWHIGCTFDVPLSEEEVESLL